MYMYNQGKKHVLTPLRTGRGEGRSEGHRSSPVYYDVANWNHLDEDVISAPSVESFKSRLAHQSCQ